MADDTVARYEVEILKAEIENLKAEVRACRFALTTLGVALRRSSAELGEEFTRSLREAQKEFARTHDDDLAHALGRIAGDP